MKLVQPLIALLVESLTAPVVTDGEIPHIEMRAALAESVHGAAQKVGFDLTQQDVNDYVSMLLGAATQLGALNDRTVRAHRAKIAKMARDGTLYATQGAQGNAAVSAPPPEPPKPSEPPVEAL